MQDLQFPDSLEIQNNITFSFISSMEIGNFFSLYVEFYTSWYIQNSSSFQKVKRAIFHFQQKLSTKPHNFTKQLNSRKFKSQNDD